MTMLGPMDEYYPDMDVADKFTVSHIQKGFKISARKLPISKSNSIDEMSEKLHIPIPEMIFGDNYVSIEHLNSGWRINFNAFDALDQVEKTDKNMLKVAYSHEWSKSRQKAHHGIQEVVKPFDWSYTTSYKGTITNGKQFIQSDRANVSIPIELLKRPDPILFFGDIVLYESELDDNGISVLTCKFRVMPDRMLLLCRFFLRLDNVIIRIRETRIYVEFETGVIIRDYSEKEDSFENTKNRLIRSGTPHSDVMFTMCDANILSNLLPEVQHTVENLTLP
ncbi:unnamed protein product [Blumeria hordei]|uniref:TIP41-like protein n=1 Tax=Blumeria hordei TaxID=2867405 RepID=A0A383V2M0_BLUHO|nr:unnamed protein product [Blumeria hordei]